MGLFLVVVGLAAFPTLAGLELKHESEEESRLVASWIPVSMVVTLIPAFQHTMMTITGAILSTLVCILKH